MIMPKVTISFEDIPDPDSETGVGVAIEVDVQNTKEGEMSTAEAVASSAFNHAVGILNQASAGELEFEMLPDPETSSDLN